MSYIVLVSLYLVTAVWVLLEALSALPRRTLQPVSDSDREARYYSHNDRNYGSLGAEQQGVLPGSDSPEFATTVHPSRCSHDVAQPTAKRKARRPGSSTRCQTKPCGGQDCLQLTSILGSDVAHQHTA